MNTPRLRAPLPVWMPGSNTPAKSSSYMPIIVAVTPVGCLSLAFCVLKPLIYSSFLPGTLHLICDERTGAGDKMFQYYRYIKRNFSFSFFFLYNACMKMRCPLASGAFISSFVEEKAKKKVVYCKLRRLRWQKKHCSAYLTHSLSPSLFIVFKQPQFSVWSVFLIIEKVPWND